MFSDFSFRPTTVGSLSHVVGRILFLLFIFSLDIGGSILVWSCMSGVLFQYRTYHGVDDWLLTLGPCRFFFGGGRRLSYSRKCSSDVTVSFSCLVT
ncbi:hypothetical protein BRARA_C03524 [Brassica rapa]|uniref:Uncharacterized protein n=1 Tax=Brassica campestris TaxID=3711 RepID=A0A398A1B1_BRACM|nr:hypothetical protein BRARA_C03524 [Brassica rapa]